MVSPWHDILRHIHRLYRRWQEGQAMCWLSNDTQVERASIEKRFMAFTQNRIKLVQITRGLWGLAW